MAQEPDACSLARGDGVRGNVLREPLLDADAHRCCCKAEGQSEKPEGVDYDLRCRDGLRRCLPTASLSIALQSRIILNNERC